MKKAVLYSLACGAVALSGAEAYGRSSSMSKDVFVNSRFETQEASTLSALHRSSDMFDEALVNDKLHCLKAMARVCPGKRHKGAVCQACIQQHSDQLRSICANTHSGRAFCGNNAESDDENDDDDIVNMLRHLAKKRRLRKQPRLSAPMKNCLLKNVHKMGKCKMQFVCDKASPDCIHVKCGNSVNMGGLSACNPRPGVTVHMG